MGNSGSFEEQLKNKTSSINNLHGDVDAVMTRIENEANRLIGLIQERNYTDKVKLCQQLGWQKVDELSSLLSVQSIEGIRYRLGMIPINTEELQANKRQACTDIVNFYLKKINLISNIQRELPKCRDMENAIYQGLTRRLQEGELNNEQWMNVYNKLERFNTDIKKRYDLIERELERVRKAKTVRELDGIAVTLNGILARTNSICSNYENDLLAYSRRKEVLMGQVSPQQPFKPLPKEPTMTTVISKPNVPQQRIITSSPEQRTITEIPQYGVPQFRPGTIVSPTSVQGPVTLTQPLFQRPVQQQQLQQQQLQQQQRQQPTLVTQTSRTNGASPVPARTTTTTIRRPNKPLPDPQVYQAPAVPQVYETSQFIQQTPQPIVYQPPVQQTLTRQPQIYETRQFIQQAPQPMVYQAPIQPTLPIVPIQVEPDIRRREITIEGERLRAEPNRIVLENPRKVEEVRTVSPEYAQEVHTSLQPQEKIVTIEPDLTSARGMGTPVRAIATHKAVTGSELSVVEGQPLTFIRAFENVTGKWAYVRNSQGKEGYVPLVYLSQ